MDVTTLRLDIEAAYADVRRALFEWNWEAAESRFHAFCEKYRAGIPTWYEDEFLFSGMQLWASGRPQQLLRHFALVFDRAAGETLCWREEDALPLAEAAALL